MAIIQALLDDINLRYRNTFTTSQKLIWMNEEQRELFEILELDSVPFSFSTVAAQYLYPIPLGVEKDRIKVMTYQINATTDFIEIPFQENDNNQYVSESDYWYTIIENNFYLNIPGGPLDSRTVYIYLDQQPEAIVSTALNIEPAVPVRYQEILKLGVLERIAAARKDVAMKNNFSVDKQEKIFELNIKMKQQEPEFRAPIDILPRMHRNRTGRHVQYVTINP